MATQEHSGTDRCRGRLYPSQRQPHPGQAPKRRRRNGQRRRYDSERAHQRLYNHAHRIVDSLRELGESQAVYAEAEVRVSNRAAEVILEFAQKQMFGTDLRPGSERLFLCPRVETILDKTPCPVSIYNAS